MVQLWTWVDMQSAARGFLKKRLKWFQTQSKATPDQGMKKMLKNGWKMEVHPRCRAKWWVKMSLKMKARPFGTFHRVYWIPHTAPRGVSRAFLWIISWGVFVVCSRLWIIFVIFPIINKFFVKVGGVEMWIPVFVYWIIEINLAWDWVERVELK